MRFVLGLALGFAAGLAVGVVAGSGPEDGSLERSAADATAVPSSPSRGAPGAPPEAGAVGPCQVTYVIDGDTLDARCPGLGDQRVRLLRIDTPERGEPGYRDATTALARLVLDRPVYLVYEKPGLAVHGNHGRLLAYVFADGRNANVEMVRLGWSEFWTRYGEGRFAREFERAERAARAPLRRQAVGRAGRILAGAATRATRRRLRQVGEVALEIVDGSLEASATRAPPTRSKSPAICRKRTPRLGGGGRIPWVTSAHNAPRTKRW